MRLALDDEYDAAVVASVDTDLLPALELVVKRFPGKHIETAAYQPEEGCEADTSAPLDVPGDGLSARHKVHKQMFEKVIADRGNYVRASTSPEAVVGQGRWDRISRRFQR